MEPGLPLPKKRKRKDEDKGEHTYYDLLVRNLKALEQTCTPSQDDDELFGRQVAATLRRFTARQKAPAKLWIQGV